jgi:hypothetical protein
MLCPTSFGDTVKKKLLINNNYHLISYVPTLWQYRLWRFKFGDTKSNRLLCKSEVIFIFFNIFKWDGVEPTTQFLLYTYV